MATYLNSTTLIESIKRRGMIPTAQNTFQDADFLDLANEETQIGLVPSVLKFHEEFLVASQETDLVANTSSYLIPRRAVGSRLRDLYYRDEQGNFREMTRVTIEDQAYYQSYDGGTYHKFYFKNGSVVLLPTVGANPTGSLKFEYYRRPAFLTTSNRIGFITNIDTVTGIITFSSLPSIFTTSTPLDFLEESSPHRTLAEDKTPTAVDSTNKTLTFTTTDIPSTLTVGDHIALAGEGYIPQLPDELHSILAQRVVCRCLESLGSTQELANANAKLAEMEIQMGILIDNRGEGTPQKIVNKSGLLRLSKISRRGIRP
jgi:hypothetical protein